MFDSAATATAPVSFRDLDDVPGIPPSTCRRFLILRDGQPFLEVNAAPRHARALVEGFNRHQPDGNWVLRPHLR